MLNKDRTNKILEKYSQIKLYNSDTPILLSGYKSFMRPFKYKSRSNIMGIINARAYYTRNKERMSAALAKFTNLHKPLQD